MTRTAIKVEITEFAPEQAAPHGQRHLRPLPLGRFLLPAACAFAVFVLALLLRVPGLGVDAPQPDEIHWMSRSHQLLVNLRSRHWSNVTSHLTHPGVPPAVVMAAGQYFAERLNARRGLHPEDPGYVDRLTAARCANAAFSSLACPLLLLLCSGLIGLFPALLASLLLAVDPHFIALSRQAHIDAGLTALVTAAVLVYFHSLLRQSTALKLLAGFFWGLCILTKPTAVSLVIGFFFFKLAISVFQQRGGKRVPYLEPPITWSDFAAAVIGVAVLVAGYSRLWHYDSPYRLRLQIKSSLADLIYQLGTSLGANPIFLASASLLVVISAAAAILMRRRQPQTAAAKHAVYAAFWVSLLLLAVALRPQSFDALLRFAAWVVGLSGEVHRGYGKVWPAPPYGYPGLIATEIPLAILAGALLGLLQMLIGLAQPVSRQAAAAGSDDPAPRPQNVFLLFCLMTVVFWILPLSVSAKQTIRYAMPVVPLIYVFSAVGFCAACAAISRLTVDRASAAQRRRAGRLQTAVALALIVLQLAIALHWRPDYGLFRNRLGSLAQTVAEGRVSALGGMNEALEYLSGQRPFGQSEHVQVLVAGDLEIINYQYKRLRLPGSKLKFSPAYGGGTAADFAMVSPNFFRELTPETRELITGQPVFNYVVDGAVIFSVYRLGTPEYAPEAPFRIRAGTSFRNTGTVKKSERFPDGVTTAVPGQANGYLLFGQQPAFSAGRYRADFYLGLPEGVAVDPALTPERYAVRLEFGSCQEIVKLGDLPADDLKSFPVICEFTRDVRASVRVYWFGIVPVAQGDIFLQREDAVSG